LHGDGAHVALIHGLSADGTSLFALRRALVAAGRSTTSPHLGHMLRPIERYAERLAAELSLIDGAFDVVAHSMGGIVLRQALVIEPSLRARIRRVVTIATPHHGTGSARFIPTPEARQLVPGGPWIDALPSLRALLPDTPITTIATDTDAIVYPSSTCRVEGAPHHELRGLGHTETLLHPQILQLVMTALT
jgi:triacylglycerol esterase/lipase EstA (alpha/beta hydrolase family)